MAIARVVTFEGVSADRMAEMDKEMADSGPPEGFPPAELLVLHDADAERSVVIVMFDNEDDYATGDAMLNAMPAEDTPGRRTSVAKYEVVLRMSS